MCPGQIEFGDAAPSVVATGLDDDVDGVLDVLSHVGIGHRDFGLERRDREALHGQLRGFGMEGGHGPAMAGVDRLEEGHGLLSADLAEDDPVGPHAQRRGQEHVGGLEFSVAVGDQGIGGSRGGDGTRSPDLGRGDWLVASDGMTRSSPGGTEGQ